MAAARRTAVNCHGDELLSLYTNDPIPSGICLRLAYCFYHIRLYSVVVVFSNQTATELRRTATNADKRRQKQKATEANSQNRYVVRSRTGTAAVQGSRTIH